jgi:hypothetical protein
MNDDAEVKCSRQPEEYQSSRKNPPTPPWRLDLTNERALSRKQKGKKRKKEKDAERYRP